jgi:4,5-DOPA dioxygenase extradiol
VLASGNVVHNLRRIAWDEPDAGFDWARRFDDAVNTTLAEAPGDVLRLGDHADFPLAVPTPDHFIPLLHIAGLADALGTTPSVFVDGFTYGSISMACHVIGGDVPAPEDDATGAGALPPPPAIPPEEANV